jgi:TolB-like protein/DNA-binding winged helix-turn-helix (wHTH) protein/Tfp pilus assembly protein PilF
MCVTCVWRLRSLLKSAACRFRPGSRQANDIVWTWGIPLLTGRRRAIRFEDFEVDPASGELRKQGVKIKLQEQPFQALIALIERPGGVVTREELQERLWPPDTVVDFDRGLNKAINRVREALGDDAERPRFIETLPQRGYRFLAQVESDLPPEPPLSARRALRRRPALAVAAALVVLLVLAIALRLQTASTRIESIAVLPLENLSGNPGQEYFSDGLTDELIGEIARIGSLRVISRTSSMRYKGGARKTVTEIARELNVDAILEGTVVQSGQRVRITAQLIRARDDRHILSESYERDLVDILALQGEVARAIAGQVQIKLTPAEQTSLTAKRQVNGEAYEAYLRGDFFLHKSLPGIDKSIGFFLQAIQVDPAQAEAHAGLAEALCYAGIFGLRRSQEAFPAARAAALKALELDPSNAGAHNALGSVKESFEWDLAGAAAEFQRALQLNPSHLLTRLWYAEQMARVGRFDDALAESGRAIALDPVSPGSLTNRAMIFFRAGRFDEAIRTSRQALDLDPAMVNALWWLGMSYAGARDFPNSIATLTKAAGMTNGTLFLGLLGHVYGRAGDRTKALATLADLTTMAGQGRYVSPMDFAIVHAGLGDANATFEWFEKACQSRDSRVHELRWMYFDGMRSDPRYAGFMRRIGL